MEWEKLLKPERRDGAIKIPYDEERFNMSDFEKDYWRIIDSSVFRRLQDKTQVFPLDKSDFVRTRLTHSLEVSTLARQLVAMVYSNYNFVPRAVQNDYPFTELQAKHAAEVAACAGLLHDIGNPPFGHFGETVLRAWFANHLKELEYLHKEADGKTVTPVNLNQADPTPLQKLLIADLSNFEGNAQALRVLTKLPRLDSKKGLNLTSPVLNTLVKYPTDSLHIDGKSENICVHKLGYYEADRELFEEVTEDTGTYFNGCHHRHPLTFILEAADDIAYATADLEDSYKKGLFTIEQFKAFYKKRLEKLKAEAGPGHGLEKSDAVIEELDKFLAEPADGAGHELQAFQKWINYIRHWLLYCAAYGFINKYKEIMEGTFQGEIIAVSMHRGTLEILKGAMGEFTHPSPGILRLELSAETIIEGLLSRFVPAAMDWDVDSASRPEKKKAESKLIKLVSENHKQAYLENKREGDSQEDREFNLYLRLLLISDFVSGMTDGYAKSLYQELNSIEV